MTLEGRHPELDLALKEIGKVCKIRIHAETKKEERPQRLLLVTSLSSNISAE